MPAQSGHALTVCLSKNHDGVQHELFGGCTDRRRLSISRCQPVFFVVCASFLQRSVYPVALKRVSTLYSRYYYCMQAAHSRECRSLPPPLSGGNYLYKKAEYIWSFPPHARKRKEKKTSQIKTSLKSRSRRTYRQRRQPLFLPVCSRSSRPTHTHKPITTKSQNV